jgi:4-amino-4-deoxy-L-arabinose transferase-like glycosyltransferase
VSGRARASSGWAPLRRWWWMPIALLSATIAAPRIFGEHWPSDAPYYQAIATEMAREGGSVWWSPMQGDLHYFNKPPLAFWIHGAMVAVFGDADWAARAPEAALYVLTCLLVGWLARRLHGPGVGMLGGCALALTSEWVRCIGNFRLEFLHTFLLLGAAACWVRACVPEAESERAGGRAVAWSLAGGVCIGLALMTKPLIGLAFPVFGCAWLAASGLLTRRNAGLVMLSGICGAVVALPWHASMLALYGQDFSRAYFWEQSLRRATGEMFHARPADWYLRLIAGSVPESIHPGLMAPIYLAALAGIVVVVTRWRRGRTRAGDALSLLWAAGWFGALCAFAGKQNYYLLVVHPGAAWLGAIAVAELGGRAARACSERRARAAAGVAAALSAVGFLAFAIVYVRSVSRRIERDLPPEQRALIEFIGANRGTPVYNGGLPYTEAALVYLKAGVWPRSLVEKMPVPPAQVPAGALMVYREDHPATSSADPADPEVFVAPVGGSMYTVRRRHGPDESK